MSDINITVTKEEIISLLERYINHPDSKELAKLIGNWMTNNDKSAKQLYKALTGIFPKNMYDEGDFVWIRMDYLSTWKFDRKLTREKNLPNYKISDKNDFILCQIVKKVLYQNHDYEVEYRVVDDNNQIVEITQLVPEESISYREESFFDFIEKMDKPDEEPDLPF